MSSKVKNKTVKVRAFYLISREVDYYYSILCDLPTRTLLLALIEVSLGSV